METNDKITTIQRLFERGAVARRDIANALVAAGVPDAANASLPALPDIIRRNAGVFSSPTTVYGRFFPDGSTSGKMIVRERSSASDGEVEYTETSGYFNASGSWVDETGLLASVAKYDIDTGEFVDTDSENTFDLRGIAPWASMRKMNLPLTVSGTTHDNWFVRCPKFYYQRKPDVTMMWRKIDENGDVIETISETGTLFLVSMTSLGEGTCHPLFLDADGVTELPFHYFSAYEGTVKSSLLLSQPTGANASSGVNRAAFLTYARNCNAGTVEGFVVGERSFSGWTELEQSALSLLFFVEFGTYNSELALPCNNTGGEYSGCGACDPIVERSREGYPADVLASGWIVRNTAEADATPSYRVVGNVYRGIENPYGDKWKFAHDMIVKLDTDNNVYRVFVAHDRANFVNDGSLAFEDLSAAGYTEISTTLVPSESRYCKAHVYDAAKPWMLFPDNNAIGTATTGTCDYIYVSNHAEATVVLGGSCASGAYCGLAAATVNDAFSAAYVYYGARPSFSLQGQGA